MKKVVVKKKKFVIATVSVTERGQFTEFSLNVPANAKRITGISVEARRTGNTASNLKTNNHFYGVAEVATYNSAFINALTKEAIQSKAKLFDVEPGANEFIYYARPKRLGKVFFEIDGINGGFADPEVVSVTDSVTGYVEDYYLYVSEEAELGAVQIYAR